MKIKPCATCLAGLLVAAAAGAASGQTTTYVIADGPGNGNMIIVSGTSVIGGPGATSGSIQSHGGACPTAAIMYNGNIVNTDSHFHGTLNGVADPFPMACGWGRAAPVSLFMSSGGGGATPTFNGPTNSNELVDLTQGSTPGYTFYGRYGGYPGSGADNREPLGTTWGTRYLNGGAFGGNPISQTPTNNQLWGDYFHVQNADPTVQGDRIPGDFDGDGVVGAGDYTVWRDNIGQSGEGLNADGNNDGTVDADDYALWRENFGSTGSPPNFSPPSFVTHVPVQNVGGQGPVVTITFQDAAGNPVDGCYPGTPQDFGATRTSMFLRGTFEAEFVDDVFAGDLDGYLLIGNPANTSVDGAYLPRNYDMPGQEADLPLWRGDPGGTGPGADRLRTEAPADTIDDVAFGGRVRLNFDTSFTGADRLRVRLTDSTIGNNTAQDGGGGIFNEGGTLSLSDAINNAANNQNQGSLDNLADSLQQNGMGDLGTFLQQTVKAPDANGGTGDAPSRNQVEQTLQGLGHAQQFQGERELNNTQQVVAQDGRQELKNAINNADLPEDTKRLLEAGVDVFIQPGGSQPRAQGNQNDANNAATGTANAGRGNQTTTRTNGAQVTTTPNGPTTVTNRNGSTVTTYPDGRVTTTNAAGTTTTTHPNGAEVVTTYTTNANGAKTVETRTTTFPDGRSSRLGKDGKITVRYPDGRRTIQTPDGNGGYTTQYRGNWNN